MSSAFKQIAVFASGKGSNTINLIDHFESHPSIRVTLVVTNNPNAEVLLAQEEHHLVDFRILTREELNDEQKISDILRDIDLVVLAGFLLKIPEFLVSQFEGRMINIHPALLPSYGGKGMYGDRVHQAVLDAGENQSGITIHLVDPRYDEGKIIFQESFELDNESLESLKQKINALEHQHLPRIVEEMLSKQG